MQLKPINVQVCSAVLHYQPNLIAYLWSFFKVFIDL